ncbi:MAG: bifunctional adenosylcobinamide kinase/adenosylcobinamide-phosphate guanylyltransferase, partial [Leptolyngbya sp. LCM1.Bin17]
VTGPARSGKSEWAEALAAQSGRSVIYVATSKLDPTDQEWQQRIQQHRDRRPEHWQLWEVPVALPEAILAATAQDCLLIDSLGTWLANALDQDDETWQGTVESLLASLQRTPSQVILVAEETGWGLVPAYPVGRLFRDRLGALTRQVGAIAGAVYLVVAGYALDVRQLGQGVGTGAKQGQLRHLGLG